MKALLLVIASLAFSSCLSIGSWSLQKSTGINADLSLGITTCLKTLNEKGAELTFTKENITQVYMHLTELTEGTEHKVTFRAETSEGPQIVQLTYGEMPWLEGDDRFAVTSYIVLNDQAEFERIMDPRLYNELKKVVVQNVEIIKPEVMSDINMPLLGVYTTELNGTKFIYVNSLVEGTDNSISHYEFWFTRNASLTTLIMSEDFNLFVYTDLIMTAQGMQHKGDLTSITSVNGKVNCPMISSYFVCSLYTECSSDSFIKNNICLPTQSQDHHHGHHAHGKFLRR